MSRDGLGQPMHAYIPARSLISDVIKAVAGAGIRLVGNF